MVIVQGIYRLDPGDRDAFVVQSLETMQTARGERGCLEYVVAADPLDPGRAILSERWESMEDLNDHISALTSRRQDEEAANGPPAIAALSSEFGFYEVASVQPVI